MTNLLSQKGAEALFGRVMRILLILGFVSLSLEALLLRRPAVDNYIGQTVAGLIEHFVGGWTERIYRFLGSVSGPAQSPFVPSWSATFRVKMTS